MTKKDRDDAFALVAQAQGGTFLRSDEYLDALWKFTGMWHESIGDELKRRAVKAESDARPE